MIKNLFKYLFAVPEIKKVKPGLFRFLSYSIFLALAAAVFGLMFFMVGLTLGLGNMTFYGYYGLYILKRLLFALAINGFLLWGFKKEGHLFLMLLKSAFLAFVSLFTLLAVWFTSNHFYYLSIKDSACPLNVENFSIPFDKDSDYQLNFDLSAYRSKPRTDNFQCAIFGDSLNYNLNYKGDILASCEANFKFSKYKEYKSEIDTFSYHIRGGILYGLGLFEIGYGKYSCAEDVYWVLATEDGFYKLGGVYMPKAITSFELNQDESIITFLYTEKENNYCYLVHRCEDGLLKYRYYKNENGVFLSENY